MQYKKIIAEAWDFTQKEKKLIVWYGFLPSLLTLTVSIIYLGYQFFSFRSSPLFLNEEKSFIFQSLRKIADFLSGKPTLTLTLIGVTALLVVFYLLLPTLFQGSIIQYISRKHNGQEVSLPRALGYGWKSFLPLLEFHTIAKSFSLIAVITEIGFILRNFDFQTVKILSIPILLIAVVGVILSLLFTYTDYFIVIDEEDVFKSISRSVNLVINHWQHTILMMILMVIIGIRILLNILIILAVPAIIIFSAGIVAALGLEKIGIYIGATLGGITLLFAAYFAAIISIFANSVWTITFLSLTQEQNLSARAVVE